MSIDLFSGARLLGRTLVALLRLLPLPAAATIAGTLALDLA